MITYTRGFKFQIKEDYSVLVDIKPLNDIDIEWVSLNEKGLLTLKKGFAWDGPSFPAIKTRSFMRGSACHDAVYMLIRKGYLHSNTRKLADLELKKMCIEDGMFKIRAAWVYKGVRFGAGSAALPSRQRKVFYAP